MLPATHSPNLGDAGNDVLDMISENTLEILVFYRDVLPKEDFQVIQKIEHAAFWLFRNAHRKT
jgi:hypothetical protein